MDPLKAIGEEVKDLASDVAHAPSDALSGIKDWVRCERIAAEIQLLTAARDNIAGMFNGMIETRQKELNQ